MLSGYSMTIETQPANPRLTLGEAEWYTVASATTLGPEQTLSGRTFILRSAPPPRESAVTTTTTDWSWIPRLVDRVRELLGLARNWDSYDAEPIGAEAAMTAALIAHASIMKGAPYPFIVPTVEGGVQLEWQQHDRDLEVEILSPTEVNVLFREHGVSVWEGSLLREPQRFEQYIARVIAGQ